MSMTRKTSWALIAALCVCLIFACSCKKQAESGGLEPSPTNSTAAEQPEGQTRSGPAESVNTGKDWEESFRYVRDSIQTEPSRFPLKTAQGVMWGRQGNPLEKAFLLAELLQEKGKTVHLAEGELDDAQAKSLLESMFPSSKSFSLKEGVPVSVPAGDPNLLAAVKKHHWVQMQKGDDWIDLDPSFPAAEPGKAFAQADNTFDPADENLKTHISISLEYDQGESNQNQAILSWDGLLEEIANQPVSLSVVAEFQGASAEEEKKGEEEERNAAGGLFGGLTGEDSKKAKGKAGEKVFYNAEMIVNGESKADGRFSPEDGDITKVCLKFKFESLGETVSESERILFERTGKKDALPIFQRHALLITGNRIPSQAWEDKLKTISDKSKLADIKAKVEDIKKSVKTEKDLKDTLGESLELEKKMGSDLGHLLNMVFASSSDDLTDQEGKALSVFSYFAVPRILITTVQGDQDKADVTFDLRQDKTEAIPLTGQARAMRSSFLYGRGVMESILEGKLLELLTGKKALTAAVLMQEAARKNIPVRMYSSLEKENIREIGLPASVAEKVLAALNSGRIIVLPERGVAWEGKSRWGWWDVDPRTMETVGVLDTGLHQAVLDRTILEEKGPLQSKMGFVIGAIVGAVDTQWMIAGMILKYGELNKAALQEAKAYMKDIQAYMCPGFEKKIGVSAEVTLVDIEDCFKIGYEAKIEAGIEIKQGWCENFAKGFACASTSILNYYLSQYKD
jgi:hypothetical protein